MSITPEISRDQILEIARNAAAIEGETVVIKMGGELADNELQREHLAADMEVLIDYGVSPIIVHGGSPHIKRAFRHHGAQTEMKDGKRITPQNDVPIVAEALREANEQLVATINKRGSDLAVAYPEGILIGRLNNHENFGSVDPESVQISINQTPNTPNLDEVAKAGKVAVVSCLGKLDAEQAIILAAEGKIINPELGVPQININGDIAATAIARILGAYKFVSLTEVGMVLDKEGKRIGRINGIDHAERLIQDGTIKEGMKPKIEEATSILPHVGSVAISSPANLAHELFTDAGAGTLVTHE